MEVLPHTGNKAHTGVKAGQHKNSGKEHKASFAKKPVCQHRQHVGSSGKAGDGGPGKGLAWPSMAYTASSSPPATNPARMVLRCTSSCRVTPWAWMFRAMMAPKFKAARVSMVW